jgi:peptidoglycan/LPS O-acetylase OafA/YrhL
VGTFRTLLALSVIFAHVPFGADVLVGGRYAVQLFYLVSGFLITHVLNENPSYRDVRRFYANRALRIFPIYYVVLVVAAVFHWKARTGFYDVFTQLPTSADLLVAISNVTILGQDFLMFLGLKNGAVVPISSFAQTEVRLFWGLVIGPSWTLALELMFYLVAPFIVRSPVKVLVLFVSSLALRGLLASQGLSGDPWTYRFFPNELALFLGGAIVWRWLLPAWRRAPNWTLNAAVAFVPVLLFTYPLWEQPVLLLLAGAFLMPALFLFQGSSRLDSAIGDLSFPIYICHLPVIQVLHHYGLRWDHPLQSLLIVLVAVLVVSWALNRFVGERVDELRVRLRRSGPADRSQSSADARAHFQASGADEATHTRMT